MSFQALKTSVHLWKFVTWTTLMMSLFTFWTRTVYHTYIFNGGLETSRTKYKIS